MIDVFLGGSRSKSESQKRSEIERESYIVRKFTRENRTVGSVTTLTQDIQREK